MVERFHRHLKDALCARAATSDWASHFPWILLGIRSAWREGADLTPAEAVFGAQPVLPGQYLSGVEPPSPFFLEEFQGLLAARKPLPSAHHSRPALPRLPEELLMSKFVLVRHDGVQLPLSPLYDGPYLVLERSLHFFKLQIGLRTDTVSTHRLKACHTPPDAVAEVPPKPLTSPSPATSGAV